MRNLLLIIIANAGLVLSACAQDAGSFSEHGITSTGEERSYLLYVPENSGDGSLPLVFSFHGSGSFPQDQVDTSNFNELADQYGFAVVYPSGVFTNSVSVRSWNTNEDPGVDDVQFVRDMIEDVLGKVNIDRSRIYSSGFSGGARITSRLACELSDVLAAAAPVAGLQYPDDCAQARAIPIITFHAEDDQSNQYRVSGNSRPYWRMGVETALDKWRQANGCSLQNNDTSLSEVVSLYTWTDCTGPAEIHFYHADTGGHSWPGSSGRGANQDINASELIWQFFSRHQLP